MFDDLTLDNWERLPPEERRALALRLGRELPDGFTFHSLQSFELGGQKRPVAVYEFGGASFALIPGGTCRLGYDPDRPWEPTREEQESWQTTAEEYGMDHTLREHLAQVTLKPRVVRLRPFLMETAAGELGWEPIAVDDPEVKEILREHFREGRSSPRQIQVHRGESTVRVRRDPE